jgi:hypothetical protein
MLNAVEFERAAKADPQLGALLRAAAAEAAEEAPLEESPQSFLTGMEVLLPVVAYTLFRLTKDFADHLKELRATSILREQEKILSELIKDGFPPDQARAALEALRKGIADNAAADPIITKALALMGKN